MLFFDILGVSKSLFVSVLISDLRDHVVFALISDSSYVLSMILCFLCITFVQHNILLSRHHCDPFNHKFRFLSVRIFHWSVEICSKQILATLYHVMNLHVLCSCSAHCARARIHRRSSVELGSTILVELTHPTHIGYYIGEGYWHS